MPSTNPDEIWTAVRLTYIAALRALEGPTLPRKISTGDLKSPFDGGPVTYRFDGKQMVIEGTWQAARPR